MVLNTHLKEPMTNYLKGISMDNVMDIIHSPSQILFNTNYINSLQHATKKKGFQYSIQSDIHKHNSDGIVAFPFQPLLEIIVSQVSSILSCQIKLKRQGPQWSPLLQTSGNPNLCLAFLYLTIWGSSDYGFNSRNETFQNIY